MDDADPLAARADITLAESAPGLGGPTGQVASPLHEAALARRMAALARARQDVPATPADLEAAVAGLLQSDPAAALPDNVLLDAVRDAACARLFAAARQNPDAAFAQAAADVEALTGRAPTLPAFPALAALVARAANLDPAAAKAFGQRLIAAEHGRRAAARTARNRARELHDAERMRLREWESELVGAEALPTLLGVPRPQVDRWIADGLIPVARSTPVRRGGRRLEELEFHPDEIAALQPQVALWKARGAKREEPAEARPRVPNGAIARRAGLDRYAAHFVNARSLQRRFTIVIGPTNSGKSHYALDRLAAAESGAGRHPTAPAGRLPQRGPMTAKLCRLAIWHRCTLIGSQSQGCPPNQPDTVGEFGSLVRAAALGRVSLRRPVHVAPPAAIHPACARRHGPCRTGCVPARQPLPAAA